MYDYKLMKKEVFTEEGYRMLDRIKTNMGSKTEWSVESLIKGISGDTWTMLACIDWLVENNEIEYFETNGYKQHHKLRIKY